MRISEVRELVQLRRPELDRTRRVLARCVTIDDLRAVARRRWPRGVRDYVEGGADAEISLRRNVDAYRNADLVPAVLRDVSAVDLSTTLLGRPSAMPLGLGPTGYTRMMHPDGESAAARAARAAGVPYTLSTMGTTRIEDVAAEAGGDLWFQLYVWRDRGLAADLMDRAQASGYHALMLTVDTPVTGLRVRDAHSGFTLPPRLAPGALLDMGRHPAWCASLLRGKPITFANFAPEVSGRAENIMEFAARQFDRSLNWADLEWVRSRWPGPLIIKGILDPEDAVRAAAVGVQAVVLSNHGGRQLDQARPPIEALPEVRARVGDDVQVFVDSGVRRGSDIALALALGADGCLIGRAYLYGLGAAGEPGAAAALQILRNELHRTMCLLGVTSVGELRERGPQLLRRATPAP